jgi:hypothetical protein
MQIDMTGRGADRPGAAERIGAADVSYPDLYGVSGLGCALGASGVVRRGYALSATREGASPHSCSRR